MARGGARALEGLDIALEAGRALVLRGPNGIGKTTLLRTIAGLQPPVEGTMEIAPDAVAYAAHADGLKTALTVTENLAFWRAVFGGPPLQPAPPQPQPQHVRSPEPQRSPCRPEEAELLRGSGLREPRDL